MRGYIHRDIVDYDPKVRTPLGSFKRATLIGMGLSCAIALPVFALMFYVIGIPAYPASVIGGIVSMPFGRVVAFRKQGMNWIEYKAAQNTWKKHSTPISFATGNKKYSSFERHRRGIVIIGKS